MAIVAVVLIHTTPSGVCQVVCRPIINYAVPLFIFLSGYLTKIDRNDWWSFYKKRIFRVIIPYIIWTILYAFPIIRHMDIKEGFLVLLKLLITTNANYAFYYIFVYIELVILTPVLKKLIFSRFRWIGWLVSPIFLISYKYFAFFTGHVYGKNTQVILNVSCLAWVIFYYFGLMLGNGLIKKDYKIQRIILLYMLSLPVQILENYILMRAGYSNFGSQLQLSNYLTSLLFLLIAYCYIKDDKNKFCPKWLVTVGNYSFGIYLSHLMMKTVLQKIPGYSCVPYIINSFLVFAVSLAFVMIFHKIFGNRISKWFGVV